VEELAGGGEKKPDLNARADAYLRLDLFMRISDEGD